MQSQFHVFSVLPRVGAATTYCPWRRDASRSSLLWADDAWRGPRWLIGLAALFPHVDPGLAISIVRRNRHIGVRCGPRSRSVGAPRLDVTLCPQRLLALGRPCGATGALRRLGDATGAAQLRARLARRRPHPLLVAADRLEGSRCRPAHRGNRACSLIQPPYHFPRAGAPAA